MVDSDPSNVMAWERNTTMASSCVSEQNTTMASSCVSDQIGKLEQYMVQKWLRYRQLLNFYATGTLTLLPLFIFSIFAGEG